MNNHDISKRNMSNNNNNNETEKTRSNIKHKYLVEIVGTFILIYKKFLNRKTQKSCSH
jgi:hypothetical protein